MDSVLAALHSLPVTLEEARTGVPALSGIYAWWGRFGALPGISGPRHPTADLQLQARRRWREAAKGTQGV